MNIEIKDDIYERIILPNTIQLLDKFFNIIYILKKNIVMKNICINKYLTIVYRIFDSYYIKINNEYNEFKKKENGKKYYNNCLQIYENAILFIKINKLILFQLNNKYFYEDLFNAYYYYYYLINNDIKSDIYKQYYQLLNILFEYLNNNVNNAEVKELEKLEINHLYYDYIYDEINNIKIKINSIFRNLKISDELIESNAILHEESKSINEEIINKFKIKLKNRIIEKKDKCKLLLTSDNFDIRDIKKKDYSFKNIVFEMTKNDTIIFEIKKQEGEGDEEEDDEGDEEEIQEFKKNINKTFEDNNDIFQYNKENFKIIKETFKNFFDNGKTNIIKNYNGNSIASLFSNFITNEKKFIFCDSDRYQIINYDDKKQIEFGIDFGNIRKKFILSLINELFEKNIFIKDETVNNKYFLNSNFKPDDSFYEIIRENNNKEYNIYFKNDGEFIEDFYKFISNLITFLLFSNYNLEKELSSYLIANYYKKSFSNYDYIYYMFNDFNNIKIILLNFLKVKETELNDTKINFNNQYLLDEKIDEYISSLNLIDYINKLSQFLAFKTIIKTKDKNIIERGELINKIFIESIPIQVKNKLSEINKINNDLINKLLLIPLKTEEEIIESFYNNIIFKILKIKDENFIMKNLLQKKYIILGNLLKFYFKSEILLLSKNNIIYSIYINNQLSESEFKLYENIFIIEFPDYFKDLNITKFNEILIESMELKEESSLSETIKNINEKLKNTFDKYNIKEVKGGNNKNNKNEYQLYIENKKYFIIYNRKKYFLTINNIKKKNNSLFININNKYMKIKI